MTLATVSFPICCRPCSWRATSTLEVLSWIGQVDHGSEGRGGCGMPGGVGGVDPGLPAPPPDGCGGVPPGVELPPPWPPPGGGPR